MSKRPLLVTIVGCVYIAAGAIGFAYHLAEITPQHPFRDDAIWIELIRLIAILSGVCVLRGRNWARWLALAWIAFHMALSAFHALPEFAVHALFCAAVAYSLFNPRAGRYFHAA
jgi:hypothetical protein